MTPTNSETDLLRERLHRLRLWGLLANFDEVATAEWLPTIIEYEETERSHRGLQRRLGNATLGSFKPIADFDWDWPHKIERQLIEAAYGLDFVRDGRNFILLGGNGLNLVLSFFPPGLLWVGNQHDSRYDRA